MRDARFILPGFRAALDGKAPADHSHSLDDVTGLSAALNGKAAIIHSHALADLPVADPGESNPTKLVRADDPRLSAGIGAGALAAQRNLVINGCARVSHRPAAALAATWQPGEVDLWQVRADGSPSAGSVKRATGVFSLSPSGSACLVVIRRGKVTRISGL